jgi:hypothetical protein
MYKKFLRSTGGKIRRDRIRNESFRDVGISEENQLQWFHHAKKLIEQGYKKATGIKI